MRLTPESIRRVNEREVEIACSDGPVILKLANEREIIEVIGTLQEYVNFMDVTSSPEDIKRMLGVTMPEYYPSCILIDETMQDYIKTHGLWLSCKILVIDSNDESNDDADLLNWQCEVHNEHDNVLSIRLYHERWMNEPLLEDVLVNARINLWFLDRCDENPEILQGGFARLRFIVSKRVSRELRSLIPDVGEFKNVVDRYCKAKAMPEQENRNDFTN